jgi:hypothetical protein
MGPASDSWVKSEVRSCTSHELQNGFADFRLGERRKLSSLALE